LALRENTKKYANKFNCYKSLISEEKRNVEIAGNECCAGGSDGVVLKETPQGWHSLSYIGLKGMLLSIQSYRFCFDRTSILPCNRRVDFGT